MINFVEILLKFVFITKEMLYNHVLIKSRMNMQPLHILLALLVVSVWGFNFVALKIALEEISPFLLVFARFFLTSIPAIFFIERLGPHLKMAAFYGLITFALQFSFLFLGMYLGVTPGLASLLLQLQVFFTLSFATFVFGEQLKQWQILGALTSFIGIGCIAMNMDGSIPPVGFLLIIAAAASWAAGNVISKKMGQVNTLSLVVWGSLFAWPPLLIINLVWEGPYQILETFQQLSWLGGGAVLYITYFATLFCFGVWSWLLRQYPLGTIAPFSLLVPIFGTLSSVLILDEPFQEWKFIAAIFVISGLCINLLGPKLQAAFSRT